MCIAISCPSVPIKLQFEEEALFRLRRVQETCRQTYSFDLSLDFRRRVFLLQVDALSGLLKKTTLEVEVSHQCCCSRFIWNEVVTLSLQLAIEAFLTQNVLKIRKILARPLWPKSKLKPPPGSWVNWALCQRRNMTCFSLRSSSEDSESEEYHACLVGRSTPWLNKTKTEQSTWWPKPTPRSFPIWAD